MPRLYTVEFEAQSVTNANGDYDLFELTPADDKPIEIYGAVVKVTSELAEAQEEWLRLRIIRGHTTSGSGGAAPTPVPLSAIDTAAGFTAETGNSTIASAGTAVNLLSDAFNVRAGWELGPLPEGYGFWCSQAATTIVLRLMAAVADDVTATGTLFVREYP